MSIKTAASSSLPRRMSVASPAARDPHLQSRSSLRPPMALESTLQKEQVERKEGYCQVVKTEAAPLTSFLGFSPPGPGFSSAPVAAPASPFVGPLVSSPLLTPLLPPPPSSLRRCRMRRSRKGSRRSGCRRCSRCDPGWGTREI